MSLTPQQIQAFDQVSGLHTDLSNPVVQKAMSGNTSVPDPSLSRADQIRAIGKTAQSTPTQTTTTVASQEQPIYPVQVAKNIGQTFKSGADQINQSLANRDTIAKQAGGGLGGDVAAAGATLGHIAGTVAGTAGGLIGSAISPLLSDSIKGKLGDAASYIDSKVQSIPGMTPEIHKSLGDVFNALTLEGGKEAEPSVTETAQKVGDVTDNAISKTVDTAGKTGEALQNKLVEGAQKDWAKPTTVNKPTYSKATDIYKNAANQGHDISKTLVDNKINLSDHIENGNYNTADTADKIRQDASKTSNELLRPSLEKANDVTPKTPVSEVISNAKDSISKDKSLTIETKNKLLEKIDETGKALKQEHPRGLSLTDLHDEKIVRGLNSKMSPVGDISTNLEAQKNNAFRDSLKTLVEQKAPKDIPVKEFNAELQKQYQTADYLDALHNKKVPVSLGGKIAQAGAKYAGAALGSIGGVPGEFAGYHLGGMLENLMKNAPGKIRDSLLGNLEKTNPEAFSKVQQYLKK